MLAAMPVSPARPPSQDAATVAPATSCAAPRVRDDACPGALRLHQADDGALARIRVPGGILDAGQAAALAEAADRLGDGELHLTSRGNIQLRGLAAESGRELAALLTDAGLLPSRAHERVRNIVASPLSGLDGAGHRDIRPWLTRLDKLLCESEEAQGLSGRFLFALDDGRGDVAALGADVTLLAVRDGGALLLLDGATQALRIDGTDEDRAPAAALTAALTFLRVAREDGVRAWRVRELPDGADALLHRLVARHLDGDATTVAVPGAAGAVPPAAVDAVPPAAADAVPPTAAAAPASSGPPPGLVRPGTPDGSADLADAGADTTDAGADTTDADTVALSVLAPLGRLTVAQWRLLARTAGEQGAGELRVTPWRGVVLPGLVPSRAAALRATLDAAGLVTDPGSAWRGVGACAGRPGCGRALADVRADAAACLKDDGPANGGGSATRGDPASGGGPATGRAPAAGPATGRASTTGEGSATGGAPATNEPLPVYWSGCTRRCGQPRGARVEVVAAPDGYHVATVAPGAEPGPGAPATGRLVPFGAPRQLAPAVAAARFRADPQQAGTTPSLPAPTPDLPTTTTDRPTDDDES
ncbi:precorrin-3B synthase [Streptomyces albus]|uniref:precorrin-3B synthase n=1 Tax=Streptomyces TaxID=1883 RepID=UPI0005264762|nr:MULTISPECIES: precorrin-3B synthase [Streptomyces]